ILNHSRPPARRTCAAWLKIQPGAARAHWLLGRVAQADLKLPEAIKEFETAVAADPANTEYAAALAGALNDGGGTADLRREAAFPTAQYHLERALELRPDYPEARTALAEARRVISVR